MRRAILATTLTLLSSVVLSCAGEPSSETFESVDELHEALNATPDYSCDPLSPVSEDAAVQDDFRKRFTGLSEFGMCFSGDEALMLHVFDDRQARDSFIGTDLWVEFVRVFWCVDDNDTFPGVAGTNWLVTSFDEESAKPLEHADELLDVLDAEEVQSVPAKGASGKCEGSP